MPRKPSLIEPHRALVGKLPDSEVARLAGVSSERVRQYRVKLGRRSALASKAAPAKNSTAPTKAAPAKTKPSPTAKARAGRLPGSVIDRILALDLQGRTYAEIAEILERETGRKLRLGTVLGVLEGICDGAPYYRDLDDRRAELLRERDRKGLADMSFHARMRKRLLTKSGARKKAPPAAAPAKAEAPPPSKAAPPKAAVPAPAAPVQEPREVAVVPSVAVRAKFVEVASREVDAGETLTMFKDERGDLSFDTAGGVRVTVSKAGV